MRVGVRVDASPQMGTGHLRRCLSLAQALRTQGAELRFVTRDLGVDSAAQIAEQGFADCLVLAHPKQPVTFDNDVPRASWAQVPQETDAEETLAAFADFDPEWVVVDSYSFDARWHDRVRRGLNCRVAQIDDVADRTTEPDLLIDHNLAADHAVKYAGRLPPGTAILGGPRYALLGPRFAAACRYAVQPEVASIGVFMGGVDADNHSSTVLDALDEIGFAGLVEVVTTSANPNLAALRARIAARKDTHLTLDLPDLANFFVRHDLQVGAGGGASWERCCLGVPTLLVVVADNQKAVAPNLAALGAIALAASPDRSTIGAGLAALLQSPDKRRDLAEKSRALVDGLGASRVAEKMLCSR